MHFAPCIQQAVWHSYSYRMEPFKRCVENGLFSQGLTHNTHAFSDHHTTSATIRIDITYIVRMLAHTLTHNTRAHGRCVQRVVAQPPLLG
jgi:hypothetical protein